MDAAVLESPSHVCMIASVFAVSAAECPPNVRFNVVGDEPDVTVCHRDVHTAWVFAAWRYNELARGEAVAEMAMVTVG